MEAGFINVDEFNKGIPHHCYDLSCTLLLLAKYFVLVMDLVLVHTLRLSVSHLQELVIVSQGRVRK